MVIPVGKAEPGDSNELFEFVKDLGLCVKRNYNIIRPGTITLTSWHSVNKELGMEIDESEGVW